MIITAEHDLGDVTITMGREEVMGVPVVMEKHHKPAIAVTLSEQYMVDPVYLHYLKTPLRTQLKRSFKSMTAVRDAIEQVLPQLPR